MLDCMAFRRKFYYDEKGYPIWRDSDELVHRTVAAKKVGGSIFPGMVVHHKDGNPHNFRRDNLVVLSRAVHSGLHERKRMMMR